jgi:hypothetical protein
MKTKHGGKFVVYSLWKSERASEAKNNFFTVEGVWQHKDNVILQYFIYWAGLSVGTGLLFEMEPFCRRFFSLSHDVSSSLSRSYSFFVCVVSPFIRFFFSTIFHAMRYLWHLRYRRQRWTIDDKYLFMQSLFFALTL